MRHGTVPNGGRILVRLIPVLGALGLWTSASPAGYSTSVQFLASGATPGLLQPGESVTVPVYYAGWVSSQWNFSNPAINFNLGALTADNTTPVDWNSLETTSQPTNVDPTAWSAIFAKLEAATGPTYGDYVQRLDDRGRPT